MEIELTRAAKRGEKRFKAQTTNKNPSVLVHQGHPSHIVVIILCCLRKYTMVVLAKASLFLYSRPQRYVATFSNIRPFLQLAKPEYKMLGCKTEDYTCPFLITNATLQ